MNSPLWSGTESFCQDRQCWLAVWKCHCEHFYIKNILVLYHHFSSGRHPNFSSFETDKGKSRYNNTDILQSKCKMPLCELGKESTTRQSSPIYLCHLKIVKTSHLSFSFLVHCHCTSIFTPRGNSSASKAIRDLPNFSLNSIFNLQIKPRPQSNSMLQPSWNIFTCLLQQKQ